MNRQPFTTMALKSKLTDNERYHLYKLSPNEIEEFINDSLNIAHENFRAGAFRSGTCTCMKSDA